MIDSTLFSYRAGSSFAHAHTPYCMRARSLLSLQPPLSAHSLTP